MRLLSKEKQGKRKVYDLLVEDTHCFSVNGGIVVHNCDALRYFAAYWSRPNAVQEAPATVTWTEDQLEDYYNSPADVRDLLIQKWGKPRNL